MGARGPYKKGVAKRAEILTTALHVIDENGYSNATVKELADAVGLSQNGLLHYFGSKDRLFIEILKRRDEQLALQIGDNAEELAANLPERVVTAANEVARAPGLLQLGLRLSVEASEPDHPAHEFFKERYENIRTVTAQALGEIDPPHFGNSEADAVIASNLITAAMDGLQAQWSYDSSLDIGAHMAHLLRALGIEEKVAASND